MIDFLVRKFVKNYEHTENAQVRTSYGVLASMVGIFCNVCLFAGKMLVGLMMNSVSVMADAFNNLSDAASSVVSFLGVKMASKPADADHPFGHGRIEYLAALAVSFMVLEVGLSFLKTSVQKIKEPQELGFSLLSLLILAASIAVKLWMSHFNRTLGNRVNSSVMHAAATDAMGDVITTSVTILSVLFYRFTNVNIDGYVGVAVALVVMWAGVGIARDTLEPLIGEAVDPQVFQQITEFVEKYDGILGSHDLIVHNYGPTKSLASIHAEVPNNADIETSHEIIDRIERDAARELGIFLVIHMDPVEMENERVTKTREQITELLKGIDEQLSLHDFRMVDGEQQINLIFDVVVPHSYQEKEIEELQQAIRKGAKTLDERYQCVLTLEKSYVAEK